MGHLWCVQICGWRSCSARGRRLRRNVGGRKQSSFSCNYLSQRSSSIFTPLSTSENTSASSSLSLGHRAEGKKYENRRDGVRESDSAHDGLIPIPFFLPSAKLRLITTSCRPSCPPAVRHLVHDAHACSGPLYICSQKCPVKRTTMANCGPWSRFRLRNQNLWPHKGISNRLTQMDALGRPFWTICVAGRTRGQRLASACPFGSHAAATHLAIWRISLGNRPSSHTYL
jgi:hypothetical protein